VVVVEHLPSEVGLAGGGLVPVHLEQGHRQLVAVGPHTVVGEVRPLDQARQVALRSARATRRPGMGAADHSLPVPDVGYGNQRRRAQLCGSG